MQLFLGFYPSAHFQVVIPYVAGYLAVGILLIIWGGFDQLSHLQRRPKDEEDDDEENEEEEEEE